LRLRKIQATTLQKYRTIFFSTYLILRNRHKSIVSRSQNKTKLKKIQTKFLKSYDQPVIA